MLRKYFSLFTIVFTIFSLNSYAAELQITEAQASNTQTTEKKEIDPKNTLYIELKDGIVIAELFPKVAPMHVQRIRTLTSEGFYDNLKFHRVINGFMAQTGDPTGTGRGGSRLGKLYAEFNNEHHTRGTLSMARASDPNSANSQFFIVTGDFFPQLDNQYTVFGRVIEGMEYVDKIKAGDTANNGIVENPDLMIKVVTGDMLNNKPIETVKEEIKVINDMQAEKLKEDPTYQKKSVLELLLKTNDIDINEVEEQPAPAVEQNNGRVAPAEAENTNNTPNANTAPAPAPANNQAPVVPAQPNTTTTQPVNAPAQPAPVPATTNQPVQNNNAQQQNQAKPDTRTTKEIEDDAKKQINEQMKKEATDLGLDFDENAIPTPYEPQN